MKIRLAILDNDPDYLSKIVSALNAKFSDKLEVYSFTDKNLAMSVLKKERIQFFIADEAFGISPEEVPRHCVFAYFVSSPDVDCVDDVKAISRYQKIESIYREILGIYSEKVDTKAIFKTQSDGCDVFIFSSPSGGVGTSTMAVACAIRCAKQGKRTLYLNLEIFGSADTFFFADGGFSLSDVMFALKSKKTNLTFKIESCMKQDKSGVYFFSQTKFALDMTELNGTDWQELISELKATGLYDCIIVDMDFRLDMDYLRLYEQVNAVIWVNTGTDVANGKTYRAFQACSMIAQERGMVIIEKIFPVYNMFSNKSCRIIDMELGIESIGGVPRLVNVSEEQIIEQLSNMEFFDNLF